MNNSKEKDRELEILWNNLENIAVVMDESGSTLLDEGFYIFPKGMDFKRVLAIFFHKMDNK